MHTQLNVCKTGEIWTSSMDCTNVNVLFVVVVFLIILLFMGHLPGGMGLFF